jgi:hypothetical protein
MWHDVASAMALRGQDTAAISAGANVTIEGSVEVRAGALQIVVLRPSIKPA